MSILSASSHLAWSSDGNNLTEFFVIKANLLKARPICQIHTRFPTGGPHMEYDLT